jgi:hypothetical protein
MAAKQASAVPYWAMNVSKDGRRRWVYINPISGYATGISFICRSMNASASLAKVAMWFYGVAMCSMGTDEPSGVL